MATFLDRFDAGGQLAERLRALDDEDVVVLGLPRGGVPVADVVAGVLDAPLDVVMVRKLGAPTRPELAMGAIGEHGTRIVDEQIIDSLGVTAEQLADVEQQEQEVLHKRATRFREGREQLDLTGRTVVIVDDGIATGATARVACLSARKQGAAKVVMAAPVASRQAIAQLTEADEIVVLSTPRDFRAVGLHYEDFSTTVDEEVVAILDDAADRRQEHPPAAMGPETTSATTPGTETGTASQTASVTAPGTEPEPDPHAVQPDQAVVSEEVRIPAGQAELEGHLHLPSANAAVVVFAHGSGSSRHSRRNRYVATVLQEAGLGTLLLDLLTTEEESDRANVFDIGLLAQRLTAAEAWVHQQPHSLSSPVGFFGASTGAAAALWAAAEPGARAGAVVSRGGRPDLAGSRLGMVEAPTLFIVGGEDHQVLELNRQAQHELRCESRLVVVAGATHLFEEPGTLEEAARLARDWFARYLPSAPRPEVGPAG